MKPGDFLLGVLDVFAILLPGSLATWLATKYIDWGTLKKLVSFGADGGGSPDSFIAGMIFLLSSYMLGHFVFMVGSQLDTSYDTWRRRNKPTDRDATYLSARAVQRKLTPEIADGEFTTFKWARTYVQVKAPQARVEIDRLEADSKFFRSLVVISVLFAGHFLLREQSPPGAVAALILGGLSWRRYREQRWKLTELSYATAVIVHAGSESRSVPNAPAAKAKVSEGT
jgi:hypothetical protein